MRVYLLFALVALPALLSFVVASPDTDQRKDRALTILERFRSAWDPVEGYMRPGDDRGWKARMLAMCDFARLGKRSVPVLVSALRDRDPEIRVFAAQTLAMLGWPDARDALEKALDDPVPAVRLYAVDGLSRLGLPLPVGKLTRLGNRDPNRDVRTHVRFALDRDTPAEIDPVRAALANYDPARLDTDRLNAAAPEFSLRDTDGREHTLEQYRGKWIVLVFIYGDT